MSESNCPEDEYISLNENVQTVIQVVPEADADASSTYETLNRITKLSDTPTDNSSHSGSNEVTIVNEESDLNKRAANFLNEIESSSLKIYANEIENSKELKPVAEENINSDEAKASEPDQSKVKKLRALFNQKSSNVTFTKSNESDKTESNNKTKDSLSLSNSSNSVTKLKDIFENNNFTDINKKQEDEAEEVEESEKEEIVMPKPVGRVVSETGDTVTISKPPKYRQIDDIVQYKEPLPLPPDSPNVTPLDIDCSVKPMPNPPSDTFTAKLTKTTSPVVSLNLPFRSRSLNNHIKLSERDRRGSITMRSISPCPDHGFPDLEHKHCEGHHNESVQPSQLQSNERNILEVNVDPVQRKSRWDKQNEEQKYFNVDQPSPSSNEAVPDGVYVRTGEVYERVDDLITSKPLGHWVTTILSPNSMNESKFSTQPMTQITNIWMADNNKELDSTKKEAENYTSLLKSAGNESNLHQIPLSRNRTLVLKETSSKQKNNLYSSLPIRGTGKRRTNLCMEKCPHNHSHTSAKQRFSRSPSPTHSWLSWASLSPPPPYRTRSLSSWGGEVGLGQAAAWKFQHRQYNQGRTPARSVSFYERSISRKQTGSPSPLFYSPEQVERRIKELKSETKKYYDELVYGGKDFHNQNDYPQDGLENTPVCSNSNIQLIGKPSSAMETKFINTNLEGEESGVDYSPIAQDFNDKCAYFDRLGKHSDVNGHHCSCALHCPNYKKSVQTNLHVDVNRPASSFGATRKNVEIDSGFMPGAAEVVPQSPPIEPVKAQLLYSPQNKEQPKMPVKSESCNDFKSIDKESLFCKFDSVRDLIKQFDSISHNEIRRPYKVKKFSYISS